MGDHLSPSRLASDVHSSSERQHLECCARCRSDQRRVQAFLNTLVADSPGDPWAERTVTLSVAPNAPEAPAEAPHELPPLLSHRYEDIGRIAITGMSEVRRVRDAVLGRVLAMKLISTDLARDPQALARFVEEAQISSQLQHPGIVPVYDAGRLADGRVWFTMKEVRGRTFTDVIRDHHQAESEWTLYRLLEVFLRICDAVSYAHACGVVHRDLKPHNVMVGSFGEILVLDWGLAKVLGRSTPDPEVTTVGRAEETRLGAVIGTPAYMSPEQARGETSRIDQRADVYALGAILYEVLTGHAPYRGQSVDQILTQVRSGTPPTSVGPDELVWLCSRAMAGAASERPTSSEVGTQARSWLDGARRRDQALAVVAEADDARRRARALRGAASDLQKEAAKLLHRSTRGSPGKKEAGWAKEDEARRLRREAGLADMSRDDHLNGALRIDPSLPEAHAVLAEQALEEHEAAEERSDDGAASRTEVRLRVHVTALSESHPVRIRATAYLKGEGAVTLITEPTGAEVQLQRWVVQDRRLVLVPEAVLGRTPMVEVPLAMGSYLFVLRHPECVDVRYPVHIGRGDRWDGVPPAAREAFTVPLPRLAQLGPDDCYVPAGWFWAGDLSTDGRSMPRRRLWCDGFVIRRFPVTNREYLAFLNDLVWKAKDRQVVAAVPRRPRRPGSEDEPPVYYRADDGVFDLGGLDPDGPVRNVDFGSATAYAKWLSLRDRRKWRLPAELEWEKAARGVDGRLFPWGDGFDPSWCNVSDTGNGQPASVHAYPADVGPYEVRGMAGNVSDWCLDGYRTGGPELIGRRTVIPRVTSRSLKLRRTRRGGHHGSTETGCAHREPAVASTRSDYLGFRLVRSYSGPPMTRAR